MSFKPVEDEDMEVTSYLWTISLHIVDKFWDKNNFIFVITCSNHNMKYMSQDEKNMQSEHTKYFSTA
jgi:hypothetical protein